MAKMLEKGKVEAEARGPGSTRETALAPGSEDSKYLGLGGEAQGTWGLRGLYGERQQDVQKPEATSLLCLILKGPGDVSLAPALRSKGLDPRPPAIHAEHQGCL